MRLRSQSGVLAVLIAASQALMLGCGSGGGGGSTPAPTTGSATFMVVWPASSRAVPLASNSIRIQVFSGSTVAGSQIMQRPAGGGNSSAQITNLPVGTLMYTATAYPQGNAQGTPQAEGSAPLTIVAGQDTAVNISMQSTITHIDLTPASPQVEVGGTVTLTATPRDAAGSQVLVAPGDLTWSTSDQSIATVNNGLVTAVQDGTATITVTEADSGKSAQQPVTVPLPVITITPASPSLAVGKGTTFSAIVTGAVNKNVAWSVQEAQGGTITSTGAYTAPLADGTYHIVATSAADTHASTVVPVQVHLTVAVSPATPTISVLDTKTFTATVTGDTNTQVNWSVQEANGGTINSSGLYTAPDTAGTYHVVATSAADAAQQAIATVTVQSGGAIITIS